MGLDTYTITAREQHLEELRVRNRQLIRLRWLYVLLLGVIGISIWAIAGDAEQRRLSPLVGLAVLGALGCNTLLWYLARSSLHTTTYYKAVAFGQVLIDIALASFVIYTQGGATARATALYAIPIIATGILFARAFVYWTAAFCAFAYIAVSVTYFYIHPYEVPATQLITAIVFYPFLFTMIATIAFYLSRINQREIRQESYDELLAMLTHQLRRPSSTIAAAVELIEHDPVGTSLTESQKHGLAIIKEENSRGLRIIANFIESGRVASAQAKSEKLMEVDIAQLVRSAAERGAQGAHRPDDLKVNIPNETINYMGNPEQLQIALDNIITNAFQYSQPESEVNVEVTSVNDLIEIHILDHGAGMTKKQQESQYKRFLEAMKNEALKAPTKVGLGLYVSKRIIEQHNGELTIESQVGKGTHIIITLTRRDDA